MGLADLFRPKHKHSDARVRAEAVRELGADEIDELARVARTDDDPKVRKLALERLDDPDRLAAIAADESEPALRRLAGERAQGELVSRACADGEPEALTAVARLAGMPEAERALALVVYRSPLATVRRDALARIHGARSLAEIARGASDPDLRGEALGRIDEIDVLRSIAVDETRKDLGFAVIDRIDDAGTLAHVASKGKSRAIRTRASRKLARIEREREQPSEAQRVHAERAQLCRTAESLARTDAWEGAAERMEEARRAWDALGEVDGELQERFDRAVRRFSDRFDRVGKPALAAARARAEAAAAPGDAGHREERAARGDEAAPGDAEAAPNAARAPEDAAPAGEDAPEPPSGREREALERREREALERRERLAQDNLEALRAVVEELEASRDTDSMVGGDRALSRAKSRYRKLDPLPDTDAARALVARYEQARRAALIHLRELREAEDWKRWANVPKKESLIRRARELLAAERDDYLPELKELQGEWKRVGPVPKDKNEPLWTEFKGICDEIFERVKAQRARRDQERKENLERRRALVERVEELAESTDWEATADEIKRLQGAWKQVGPVPRKQGDPLWKRFRAACDRFFERRKPHLEKRLGELRENLARKQEIAEAAEKLADDTEDWEQAERELARLRREFRKTGSVPRKEVASVGDRMRAACDRFFERRDEALASVREERRSALDGARQRLEARLSGQEIEEGDAAQDAIALRAALRELGRIAADEETARRAEVDELTARAIAAFPDAFAGTDLDPEAVAKRKRKLCERAEELVPDRPEVSAEASPDEVAATLQAALAENALGVNRAGGRPVADVVGELREQWARLGPVPGADGDDLEARFRAACERALAAEPPAGAANAATSP